MFDTETLRGSDLTKFQVFNEVHAVLNELKEIADLGILSQGEIAFQRKKLIESNIAHYFLEEHIHIVEDKETMTQGILDKYNSERLIIFIDDRLPILHLAKVYRPDIITIWVKRGHHAEKQLPIDGFTPDKEVFDLEDIVSFIREL